MFLVIVFYPSVVFRPGRLPRMFSVVSKAPVWKSKYGSSALEFKETKLRRIREGFEMSATTVAIFERGFVALCF